MLAVPASTGDAQPTALAASELLVSAAESSVSASSNGGGGVVSSVVTTVSVSNAKGDQGASGQGHRDVHAQQQRPPVVDGGGDQVESDEGLEFVEVLEDEGDEPSAGAAQDQELLEKDGAPRRQSLTDRGSSESAPTEGGVRDEQPAEMERFPEFKPSPPVVLDGELEEQFTRIVIMKHAPRFRDTLPRTIVWQAIVEDSRGRFEKAKAAQLRTIWLCKVASLPRHTLHHRLTPALRDMLLEIHGHLSAGYELDGYKPQKPMIKVATTTSSAVEGTGAAQQGVSDLIAVAATTGESVAKPRRGRPPKRASVEAFPSSASSYNDRLSKARYIPTKRLQMKPLQGARGQQPSHSEDAAELEQDSSEVRAQLRELRAELRNLHEEFRQQRENHHRETTAMLRLLEKEREDRTEEFKAMMGLITRFGAPSAPPPADRARTSSAYEAVDSAGYLI